MVKYNNIYLFIHYGHWPIWPLWHAWKSGHIEVTMWYLTRTHLTQVNINTGWNWSRMNTIQSISGMLWGWAWFWSSLGVPDIERNKCWTWWTLGKMTKLEYWVWCIVDMCGWQSQTVMAGVTTKMRNRTKIDENRKCSHWCWLCKELQELLLSPKYMS